MIDGRFDYIRNKIITELIMKNKMTEQKITHNGEEYIIPQNVIDDLMKFHGRDAVKEVEEMLKRNDEVEE